VSDQRQLFDPALGENRKARVVMRNDMQAGHYVEGPAAISEDETTVILPQSRCATMQPDGCIDVQLNTQTTSNRKG